MEKATKDAQKLESALKRAYQSIDGMELGQNWQDQIMRDVRQEVADEERSLNYALRTAWMGALCAVLFFGYVFRGGIGLQYEITRMVVEEPVLSILNF